MLIGCSVRIFDSIKFKTKPNVNDNMLFCLINHVMHYSTKISQFIGVTVNLVSNSVSDNDPLKYCFLFRNGPFIQMPNYITQKL